MARTRKPAPSPEELKAKIAAEQESLRSDNRQMLVAARDVAKTIYGTDYEPEDIVEIAHRLREGQNFTYALEVGQVVFPSDVFTQLKGQPRVFDVLLFGVAERLADYEDDTEEQTEVADNLVASVKEAMDFFGEAAVLAEPTLVFDLFDLVYERPDTDDDSEDEGEE